MTNTILSSKSYVSLLSSPSCFSLRRVSKSTLSFLHTTTREQGFIRWNPHIVPFVNMSLSAAQSYNTEGETITPNSTDLVACNIYISAGQPHHAPLLLNLLQQAQTHARDITSKTVHNGCPRTAANAAAAAAGVTVVHAYADGPYDRSSIHLAGDEKSVALLASKVAISAIDSLVEYHQTQTQEKEPCLEGGDGNNDTCTSSTTHSNSRHPLVGLVDHISIMPLVKDVVPTSNTSTSSSTTTTVKDETIVSKDTIVRRHDVAASKAAIQVAQALKGRGVNVQLYGTAHPTNLTLAQVRRDMSFFQSGSLLGRHEEHPQQELVEQQQQQPENPPPPLKEPRNRLLLGSCTVGSPPNFVENYNLRFTSRVPFAIAKTMTKRVRTIPGVEALTLKYSDDRIEVACNLTLPHQGSVFHVEECLDQWWMDHYGRYVEDNPTIEEWVDAKYRVGTTVDQCRHVLDIMNCEVKLKRHEEEVKMQFKNGFSSNHEDY